MTWDQQKQLIPKLIGLYAFLCLAGSAGFSLIAFLPDSDGFAGLLLYPAMWLAIAGGFLLACARWGTPFALWWFISPLACIALGFLPGFDDWRLSHGYTLLPGMKPLIFPMTITACSFVMLANFAKAGHFLYLLASLNERFGEEEKAASIRRLHGVPSPPKP